MPMDACMQRNTAWLTWSRNDFHRKYTVCGESDSWVHGRSKEVPPYYVQNNYSSTLQRGPTGRAMICCEKKRFPLTAGTHQLHLSTQGSASGQKTKRFAPLTAGTHQLHLRTQRKCVRAKKRFAPLTAGTHQLHFRTQGTA